MELQKSSFDVWQQKYQLKDAVGNAIDKTYDDTFKRIAKALARYEKDSDYWYDKFLEAIRNGATPAGRIIANAGAEEYKPSTSLINCTVSQIVEDSMEGILEANKQSGLTLASGAGIGYEFSTLRPRGSFVQGAGAHTSGPLSFMDIFDSMCFTIASAGGRRGAQMATFAVWHPDVEDFITAKREDGRLRQFNMSLLIDDEFMEAVKNDTDYHLVFPVRQKEIDLGIANEDNLIRKKRFWEKDYCNKMGYLLEDNEETIVCKIHKTIKAKDLWNTIMNSTYDFAEPGFLLIDRINDENNNYFTEEIRATNPCGEQPLPPNGSCLLGSINVAKFVKYPFTDKVTFDWDSFVETVRVFTRMLDNVVEMNGLPLEKQRKEIEYKRRHGMGFLGLGSAMTLLGMEYGSEESIRFTNFITKTMAIEGFKVGIDLAKEKGPAPIFNDSTKGISNKELWSNGNYMNRIFNEIPEYKEEALKYGCRFTHHTSIAPTGTISFSINNNTSNGVEPTFAHKYTRNIIIEGQKAKQAVDVYSYEMLLYKEITGKDEVPEWWSTTENITPISHVDVQAVAQKWCDSSISKTINVPTEIDFKDFKDIYIYAYDNGLKGCTTFRYNPEAFSGVLVKDSDLEETEYVFILEDGEEIIAKGNDMIEYEEGSYSAQNLYDSFKEGTYGKY